MDGLWNSFNFMLIFVSKTFMLQTSNQMWILWKMRSFNKKYLLEQASKSTNFLQSQPFMENSWWSRNIAIRNPCFSPSYYFWRNKHMSRNNCCDISSLYEMCWQNLTFSCQYLGYHFFLPSPQSPSGISRENLAQQLEMHHLCTFSGITCAANSK